MRKQIAASIMCADQLHLKEELRKLEEAGVDLLHCDVMDGVFVNNLAMGPYVLEEIKAATSIPLDIHLATVTPDKYIDMFSSIKPEYLSFHIETTEDAGQSINLLQKHGIKPAIAISPETPVEAITPYLSEVAMVLMMTVNPGFAGQKFNHTVLKKLDDLQEKIANLTEPPLIEVDGNINEDTVPELVAKGADIYVLGTSQLFNDKPGTFQHKIDNIRKLFREG